MTIDEPIRIVTYSSQWPLLFQREADRLSRALGSGVMCLEHIGSTAVPGLDAKPVIDNMAGVSDLQRTNDLAMHLQALGYEDCGFIGARRYFRSRDGQHFNIQVVEFKSDTWQLNITLRDYLRSNNDAARRYAEAKRIAASQAPMLLAYSALTAPIIDELLECAAVGLG